MDCGYVVMEVRTLMRLFVEHLAVNDPLPDDIHDLAGEGRRTRRRWADSI